MQKLIILSLLLFPQILWAHFNIGQYKGTLDDGAACTFEIKSVQFKNNLKHPLNEIVNIDLQFLGLGETEFKHLGVVDLDQMTVRPKPEVLTAIFPNEKGATAVEMLMNHDGPYQVVMVSDNYKASGENTKTVCNSLVYQDQ